MQNQQWWFGDAGDWLTFFLAQECVKIHPFVPLFTTNHILGPKGGLIHYFLLWKVQNTFYFYFINEKSDFFAHPWSRGVNKDSLFGNISENRVVLPGNAMRSAFKTWHSQLPLPKYFGHAVRWAKLRLWCRQVHNMLHLPNHKLCFCIQNLLCHNMHCCLFVNSMLTFLTACLAKVVPFVEGMHSMRDHYFSLTQLLCPYILHINQMLCFAMAYYLITNAYCTYIITWLVGTKCW